MEHFIVFKKEGHYSGMPTLNRLQDGRLLVACRVQTWGTHHPVGGWPAFVSTDDGETWAEDDDPALPPNWPASSNREKLERLERVMLDGSYLCAGCVGQEIWPEERRSEAEERGLQIMPHPRGESSIIVGGHKLFVQRSTDEGKTWSRREWDVPGMSILNSNRPPTYLADGTILLPLYGFDRLGNPLHYIWRSVDQGYTWRMHPMGTHGYGIESNETGLVEVAPSNVLAHTRVETHESSRFLIERWSDDGGITWTDPVGTGIWGFPADLLKLRDGRILCCYGYRRKPGGVRAVLSEDGGETWDTDNTVVLRDDGGYSSSLKDHYADWGSDVGYPVSIQLDDDSILTAYYITQSDRITHTAVTRWEA